MAAETLKRAGYPKMRESISLRALRSQGTTVYGFLNEDSGEVAILSADVPGSSPECAAATARYVASALNAVDGVDRQLLEDGYFDRTIAANSYLLSWLRAVTKEYGREAIQDLRPNDEEGFQALQALTKTLTRS